MNYTQAQIDRANAVSLEDFLRTQGETLIKSGREYRWKEHDSLTVRGNKWFRHSQSKGGYPIDFVMEFYGKSFPEAVQLLTGESGEGQTEASTTPPTAFHLPLHNRTADRAIQFLCESRGLNKTLVEAFLLSGDIYEDAKRHNVVFVGRDRSGTPRYAHVRGTADPFRQDIAGSDKSYPFRHEGNGNQLFVFEAPIDLLSFICLYPQDWQTRSYLALGGVSGKALDRFLSERKDTVNSFTSDEYTPFDDANGDDYDSGKRYKVVVDSFTNKIKDDYLEETKQLLMGKYGFMCQYEDPNFETVWSSIFDLESLMIYRAEGDPRKKRFISDNRLHGMKFGR